MPPTTSWDETSPAGSDALNAGDNRIREMKTQIREVIDVDHQFDSSGSGADNGCHDQVTLLEKADIGTGAVGKTKLGSQTVSGVGELVYTTETDADIQLTKGDKIHLNSGRLTNNTALIGRNAADSGNINIIKVNASDIVEIPTICQLKNASVMESSAAPSADAQISNKKYVDDTATTLTTAITAATISSIKDYGSSTSSGTTRASSVIKICYGQATQSAGSFTISNLPFATTSYTIVVTREAANVGVYQSQAIEITSKSASSFTAYDNLSNTKVVDWFCIGI